MLEHGVHSVYPDLVSSFVVEVELRPSGAAVDARQLHKEGRAGVVIAQSRPDASCAIEFMSRWDLNWPIVERQGNQDRRLGERELKHQDAVGAVDEASEAIGVLAGNF